MENTVGGHPTLCCIHALPPCLYTHTHTPLHSYGALCIALYSAIQLATPLLLRLLIDSIESGAFAGLYYALALFGAQVASAVLNNQHLHSAFRVGQRLRALVMDIVYRKALKLTTSDRQGTTNGSITNLLANDSQKFFEVMPMLHLSWAAPLQIVIATFFLFSILGWSAFVGKHGCQAISLAQTQRLTGALGWPQASQRWV